MGMCCILYADDAFACYGFCSVGFCGKRRQPWTPNTLPSTRAPRRRSRAILATAVLTRTRSSPAARAPAPASPVLRCLPWVRRHLPGLHHAMGARAGANRVGAGPGRVLSVLA
eukprot:3937846-Prymnesium_polylepis.1